MKPTIHKSEFRVEVRWASRFARGERDAVELKEYIDQLKGLDVRLACDIQHGCPRCGMLFDSSLDAKEHCLDETENLCDTCKNEFATCGASEPKFGTGVGNDNVFDCDKYEERPPTPKEE